MNDKESRKIRKAKKLLTKHHKLYYKDDNNCFRKLENVPYVYNIIFDAIGRIINSYRELNKGRTINAKPVIQTTKDNNVFDMMVKSLNLNNTESISIYMDYKILTIIERNNE